MSSDLSLTPHSKQNSVTDSEEPVPDVYRAAISLFSMQTGGPAEEYILVDASSLETALEDPNRLSVGGDKRIQSDVSLDSKNFGAFISATTNRPEHSVSKPFIFPGPGLNSGAGCDPRSSLSPTFRAGMLHLFTTPLPPPEQSPTTKPHPIMKSPDALLLADAYGAWTMDVETGTTVESFDLVSLASTEIADEQATPLDLKPTSKIASRKRKYSMSTPPDSPCTHRRTRLWSRY